jgi:hypothetical protein
MTSRLGRAPLASTPTATRHISWLIRRCRSRTNRVREVLVANSALTRLAFVAMTTVWAYSWTARGKALPDLPTVSVPAIRRNRALWGRYVPDAHGIQILTDEHLEEVSDLSTWNVTPLNHGRYLVEATDLTAWFGPNGPSESLIAKARADFGRAIVSPETLAQPSEVTTAHK